MADAAGSEVLVVIGVTAIDFGRLTLVVEDAEAFSTDFRGVTVSPDLGFVGVGSVLVLAVVAGTTSSFPASSLAGVAIAWAAFTPSSFSVLASTAPVAASSFAEAADAPPPTTTLFTSSLTCLTLVLSVCVTFRGEVTEDGAAMDTSDPFVSWGASSSACFTSGCFSTGLSGSFWAFLTASDSLTDPKDVRTFSVSLSFVGSGFPSLTAGSPFPAGPEAPKAVRLARANLGAEVSCWLIARLLAVPKELFRLEVGCGGNDNRRP